MDRHEAMRVFVKVAELQSFTRAAEQLGIPRATATTSIQGLEETVRARLLHRTTRTVALTAEGAAYLERCRNVLADIDEMESMFQVGTRELTGTVRVDMASSLAKEVVIPQLPAFFELHPHIEVEIVGVDRKVDLVREGIDCTIRGGPLEPGMSAVDLELGDVLVVNAVSPAYLKRYGKPKRLEDLKHHALIRYASTFGQPPDGFEYFDGEKSRYVRMKGVVTVSSIDAYKAAALAGLGICQNPRIGIAPYLRDGRLVEVLPRFRPPPGPSREDRVSAAPVLGEASPRVHRVARSGRTAALRRTRRVTRVVQGSTRSAEKPPCWVPARGLPTEFSAVIRYRARRPRGARVGPRRALRVALSDARGGPPCAHGVRRASR